MSPLPEPTIKVSALRRDHGDKTIPDGISASIQIRGETGTISWKSLHGKYKFVFDAGYLHLYDPHGFGTIRTIERGVIRSLEITGEWDESEVCKSFRIPGKLVGDDAD